MPNHTYPTPLAKYWVTHCEWHSNLNESPAEDGRDVAVYIAEDVVRRDEKIIAWFREYLEWNACVAKDDKGIYACDECCLLVEAQRLLEGMEGRG